jgi:hypothetical protein
MFDITNRELIKRLIDERKTGAYVKPMYVKIYNEAYGINELREITNYNPSAFKIGFGIHVSILDKYTFPNKMIQMYDPVEAFTIFDETRQISEKYIIFETGSVDIDMTTLDGGKQYQVNTSDAMRIGEDDRIMDTVSVTEQTSSKLSPVESDVMQQIAYYHNMLKSFLAKQQEETRKKRISEALSDWRS